jgi:flagellar biosynthesis/type III secretory pathway chaperone
MDTKELKNNVASIDSAIEKLLEITRTKQTVLIQRNHEELNNLIEKEQQLLNTLSHLSKHQKSLTNSIKIEFNIDEDTNSLTHK